jgi:DNA-binding NtrC family response regulator
MPLSNRTSFGGVIGSAIAMRRLYPLLEKLSQANVPVLIEGETGTGKELLAEAIHREGPRADGPFIVVDCTAIPPNLIESELFGHERGAFTGATSQRRGMFERASGGTLLIDEIGELDVSLQPKLLRALERGEIRRVGGDITLKVDVRVLAATRRDLDQEVAAGRFRDDLFHRLVVARVELPPLRARKSDIALLAEHFWLSAGGTKKDLPTQEIVRWQAMDWPGNVRELRNAMSRFAALGSLSAGILAGLDEEEEELHLGAEALRIEEVIRLDLPLSEARRVVLERLEREYVRHLLARHGGTTLDAAHAAGVQPRHLRRLAARLRG